MITSKQIEEIPSTYAVLEAMREAGGWYIRKRKRVLPALMYSVGHGAVAPATPTVVERWLCKMYPAYRVVSKRYLRRGAEEVIAEAKYHDYGLPVIDERTLGRVSP